VETVYERRDNCCDDEPCYNEDCAGYTGLIVAVTVWTYYLLEEGCEGIEKAQIYRKLAKSKNYRNGDVQE